jgi:hypothetical protein
MTVPDPARRPQADGAALQPLGVDNSVFLRRRQRRSRAVIEPGEGVGHEARETHSGVAVATSRGRDAGIVARAEPGEASAQVTAAVRRIALAAAGVAVSAACAHNVRVESNVPEAVVRVDGEAKGTVADGAVFVERWGFKPAYDIDVAAPGYRTARRQLRPSIAEPAIAVPAIAGSVGGCIAGGCVLPLAAVSSTDAVGFYGWTGLSALTLAAAGGACAVAFGASERLPDVVTVNLEQDAGAGVDGDLPPPPVDADDPTPLPPDGGGGPAAPPAGATSAAGAATFRW